MNQARKVSNPTRAGRLPAMCNPQPHIQFQYSRLLPFHRRISKAYNTQIVKGTLYSLRSQISGRASL